MKSFLFAVIALLLTSVANAGNVTITWTHDAATCADNTAPGNCAVTGFEVQEKVNDVWTVRNTVGVVLTTGYTNVLPGRHCYRLRAVASGVFSSPSNEACIDMPASPPRAPVITVTITIATP